MFGQTEGLNLRGHACTHQDSDFDKILALQAAKAAANTPANEVVQGM